MESHRRQTEPRGRCEREGKTERRYGRSLPSQRDKVEVKELFQEKRELEKKLGKTTETCGQ